MRTLTIDVRSLSDSLGDAVLAMETGRALGPRYSFSSAQALMRTLGGKRFDLIQALAGAGAVTIREGAARRVRREGCAWRRADTASLRGAGQDRRRED